MGFFKLLNGFCLRQLIMSGSLARVNHSGLRSLQDTAKNCLLGTLREPIKKQAETEIRTGNKLTRQGQFLTEGVPDLYRLGESDLR